MAGDGIKLIAAGFASMMVGMLLWAFGPGVVSSLWRHSRQEYTRIGVHADWTPIIEWGQKLMLRLAGAWGIIFGVLMVLTSFGVVDGFALLDQLEAWARGSK